MKFLAKLALAIGFIVLSTAYGFHVRNYQLQEMARHPMLFESGGGPLPQEMQRAALHSQVGLFFLFLFGFLGPSWSPLVGLAFGLVCAYAVFKQPFE